MGSSMMAVKKVICRCPGGKGVFTDTFVTLCFFRFQSREHDDFIMTTDRDFACIQVSDDMRLKHPADHEIFSYSGR